MSKSNNNRENKLDKKYMDLSLEISNEKLSRIIENSKLKALNLKESTLRVNNDNKLNDLVSKKYESLTDEINKLKILINDIKKEDENYQNILKAKEEKEENKIINDTDGTVLLEIKEKELLELEEDMKYLMNLLNIAINERNGMQKSNNYDSKYLSDINKDINFITEKVEVSKQNIQIKRKDIESVISLKNSLNNARKKEYIKQDKLDLYNLIKEFNELKDALDTDMEKISLLLEINKDLVSNIKDNKYFIDFNDVFQPINKLLNNSLQKFDALYLFLKKARINISGNYTKIDKANYFKFDNIDDIIQFHELILDSIKYVKTTNLELKSKTKDIDAIYLQTKNIGISLENLYDKIKIKESRIKLEETKLKLQEKEEAIRKEKELKLQEKEEAIRKEKYLKLQENVRKIFKRVKSDSQINLELDGKITTSDVPSDHVIYEDFLSKHIKQSLFTEKYKIRKINVEDNYENSQTQVTFGKIVSTNYYYDNLHVKGSGLKSAMTYINGTSKYYSKFKNVEYINNIEIFDEQTAINLANNIYNIKGATINTELCYYSNNDSEFIVPAYHVSGTIDNINLLETIIPASMEHIPTNPQFDNVEIVKETTSLKNNQLNENDTDNIDNDINEINHLNFNINLKGFEATDNKINIVSVFDTINNIRKNSSFKISLPLKITKKFGERLNNISILLISTNEYGFTNKIKFVLDLSDYISNFIIIEEPKPNHGGNRHNYGIEWAESDIGGIEYSRFIKEMNKNGVHKEYSLDSQESLERHFKDSDNEGEDDHYVDNVDISAYIGHGSGSGFTFETAEDDSNLTNEDARGGNAWGNRDLEFQALMSCQVLKENHNGQTWAQRWGPSFNGLHLLCGFQTNAYISDNNMLKFFVKNMYNNELTVMNSWLHAALNDQPDDVEAVVMGPLIESKNKDAYKSIESSIDTLYRAHWNDRTWGIQQGPGIDNSRDNIAGWWRVVITV